MTKKPIITGPGEYRTTNGCKAIVLSCDLPGDFNCIGYLAGERCVRKWNGESGHYAPHPASFEPYPGSFAHYNIVGVWREPIKIEGWVNVYASGRVFVGYATRAEADANAGKDRIACIRVTGTEEIE